MTLKGIVKDFRTYVAIFGAVVFISGVIGGWIRFPVRLAEAEEKIEVNEGEIGNNKDHVQKLAHTVDKYIEVNTVAQAQKEKSDKEHRELILELIRQKK